MPKKAATSQPTTHLRPSSPAKSSRGTRSRNVEDGWDSESSSYHGNGLGLGLQDTSVNIAAAFHAAQNGHLPVVQTQTTKPTSKRNPQSHRALSPAEQLAESARALSPVKFFLRATQEEEDSEYNSFASLGQQSSNMSYNYEQEEEFVRAAQAASESNPSRRRKKSAQEDMPYRPEDDDYEMESDGGGVVKSGALEGRAATRGKRREQGEGYLGSGLGLKPRKGKKQDELEELMPPEIAVPETPRSLRRSPTPTPTQQMIRALTPRSSPAPSLRTFHSRRRPSNFRTIITNLLHGVVLALRFVVDLTLDVFKQTIAKPLKIIFASGKSVLRRRKEDWWKWLGALLALSLALRLLQRPQSQFVLPTGPPESMNELASRLTSLEEALASLAGDTTSDTLSKRLAELEKNLHKERARLDAYAIENVKAELHSLVSKVGINQKAVLAAQATMKVLDRVERDVQTLQEQIHRDEVFEKAVEKVLPSYLPVRKESGQIVLDSGFKVELERQIARSALSDKQLQQVQNLLEKSLASGQTVSRSELERALDVQSKKINLPTHTSSHLQDLIDAALLKYSKDTLAKADYVLFTSGGRVVPSITSDTLVLQPASSIAKWFGGKRDVEGRSPATALHPDTSVGSCWPFKGAQGQLGVLLSRRVIVTEITVEHAAKELAMDVSTAPRNIEVYGLVEGKHNQEKLSQSDEIPLNHLLLANITYDPGLNHPIQTFPIASEIAGLGVDVGIVIFRVQSNWGGDFTCLYRVRVHGEEVEPE